jgi:hypothetical protein
MKKYKVILFIMPILFGCVSQMPARPVPIEQLQQNNIFYEFEDIPEIIHRGETGFFIIKTNPQNVCYGNIAYIDSKGDLAIHDLPDVIADEDGFCTFQWEITDELDVIPGWGSLKVVIGENDDFVYPNEKEFCIYECQ